MVSYRLSAAAGAVLHCTLCLLYTRPKVTLVHLRLTLNAPDPHKVAGQPRNMRRSDCRPAFSFCFLARACHGTEAFSAGLHKLILCFGAVTKEPARDSECMAPKALLHDGLPDTCHSRDVA